MFRSNAPPPPSGSCPTFQNLSVHEKLAEEINLKIHSLIVIKVMEFYKNMTLTGNRHYLNESPDYQILATILSELKTLEEDFLSIKSLKNIMTAVLRSMFKAEIPPQAQSLIEGTSERFSQIAFDKL